MQGKERGEADLTRQEAGGQRKKFKKEKKRKGNLNNATNEKKKAEK